MKKLVLSLAVVASSAAAVITLCSFASTASTEAVTATEVHTHAASQGKHCSGSVGCDCSRFSPITNGDEWQKSYCKHCGHKKSCHR